ncbi:MAG: APC family permease [Proteobacteria bacterium]|nr:APC family permease [Pseudomonadota bacterium]
MHKKNIGLISATFLGISCVIGSGWLFSPFKTAAIAGPSALITWIFSGLVMLLLALCFAEVASLYPKRGLSAIIPSLSHNKFFGFPFAIANWFGIVAVIGLEADATVQYLMNLTPHLKPFLFSNNQLTWQGNCFSIALVLVYSLLNYWGARALTKANNVLSILKVIVPIVTALIFIAVAFHPSNFTAVNNSFVPYGIPSIVGAILTTGIIVSFNGFQSIVSFASEIKKPEKTIPLALIISLTFCLGVYLLLQVAFIGAIPPQMLAKGWHELQFSAPMIQLCLLIGFSSFASIIYFGATVAPVGAGVAFTGTATRMFTAMARSGQMPSYFNTSHHKYNVSRHSLIANTALSVIFLILFRSWSQLAEFISLFHIISYLPIPLALCVFRKAIVTRNYPFRLWGGHIIALLVFVIFTYLFTLGHIKTTSQILLAFLILQIIFIAVHVRSGQELFSAIQESLGILLYFAGVWLLTLISPTQNPNINGLEFAGLVVIFSVATFYFLIKYKTNNKAELSAEQKLFADQATP